MLTKLPWDLAPHLPWHFLTNPVEKWTAQPSFLVGEYLFYTCAVLALVHAFSQGPEKRKHILAWVAALLAGTANDMIFMALPIVDNFWQAQGTIMLTPRLPLYIPCVYICFMYFPLVSVWRLNLPPWPRAALSGLCGSLFYAPYDIVGAKFLWWTWHDSDRPIANRILGAPIGSTMWVLLFVASFAWLFNRVVDRDPSARAKTCAKTLALVCGCSTLVFLLIITPLRFADGGIPGPRGLVGLLLVYAALIVPAWMRTKPLPPRRADRLLHAAVVLYFLSLFTIGAVFDPQTHRSASVHQTYGPCHVKAIDSAGNLRWKFLCAEDFDEDFTFACVDKLPAPYSEWYTVCGRPHANFARFMLGLFLLCGLGIALYSHLLGLWRRRTADESPSKWT